MCDGLGRTIKAQIVGSKERWWVGALCAGLSALRHHIVGLRNRRRSGFRGLRRLRGLLRLPGLTLLLRLLHVLYGGAEGALQLRALFRNIAQHDELFFAEFDELVDLPLAIGNPREQPLGGDHGFQVAAFGAVLGLAVGIQLVIEPGVSAAFSLSRTVARVRRPQVRALKRMAALPSVVLGPVKC